MAVNEKSIMRAYRRILKKLEQDPGLLASSNCAGFIFEPGQKRGKRKGLQVFVEVHRYSDEKLTQDPASGGLLSRL